MPSTQVQFSWAVPIDVVRLGAHLEAYTNLLPALHVLHLCKRSAKQRLSVDVLEMIETYLFESERVRCVPEWKQQLVCWEEQCSPLQHFDKRTKRIKEADRRRAVLIDDLHERYPREYSTAAEKRALDRSVRQHREEQQALWDRIRERERVRLFNHQRNAEMWQSKVRQLSSRDEDGLHGRMAEVLRRDFGLEVWCSHTRLRRGKKRRERDAAPWLRRDGGMTYRNMCASTIAYLRLPEVVSLPLKSDPVPSRTWPSNHRQSAELGWALRHELPTTPSARSLSRFARATRRLSLRTVSEIRDGQELGAMESVKAAGEEEHSMGKGKIRTADLEHRAVQPALTTFVVHRYLEAE